MLLFLFIQRVSLLTSKENCIKLHKGSWEMHDLNQIFQKKIDIFENHKTDENEAFYLNKNDKRSKENRSLLSKNDFSPHQNPTNSTIQQLKSALNMIIRAFKNVYLYLILVLVKLKDENMENIYELDSNFHHNYTDFNSISNAIPTIKFSNRYNVGFAQAGELQPKVHDKHFLAGSKPLNDLGYYGENEIITVLDSGAYVNSWLSNDDSKSDFPTTLDQNQRKVILFSPKSNSSGYADISHGTHIATTIAGDSLKTGSNLTLYNGIAKNSKLSIVEYDELSTITININRFSDSIRQTQSTIALCAFNSDNDNKRILSTILTNLSYDNPSTLLIISAGNKGPSISSLASPADIKGALTVGSLESFGMSLTNAKRLYSSNPNLSQKKGKKKLSSSYNFVMTIGSQSNILYNELPNFATVQHLADYDPPFAIYDMEIAQYQSTTSDFSELATIANTCDEINQIFQKNGRVVILESSTSTSLENCVVQSVSSEPSNDKICVLSLVDQTISNNIVGKKVSILPDININILNGVNIAEYSSLGPSQYGSIKPEVFAPGSDIISACSSEDHVCAQSGTSMAAAVAAGTLAALREYILKKFSINSISSFLLKALAILSADKPQNEETIPDNIWGFGFLNISNIVEEISGNKLFFQDSIAIHDGETKAFTIQISETDIRYSDLRIAISYNDIPINSPTSTDLYYDLDLYLVSPSKTVYHPNRDSEELFSTSERIIIPHEELLEGEYAVYVKATNTFSQTTINANLNHLGVNSKTSKSSDQVNFAIAISGPVLTLTESIFTFDNSLCHSSSTILEQSNSKCVCNENSTGLFCQHSPIFMNVNQTYSIVIKPREIKYFSSRILDDYYAMKFHSEYNDEMNSKSMFLFMLSINNMPSKLNGYEYYKYFNQSIISLNGPIMRNSDNNNSSDINDNQVQNNITLNTLNFNSFNNNIRIGSNIYFFYANLGESDVTLKLTLNIAYKTVNGETGNSNYRPSASYLMYILPSLSLIILAIICFCFLVKRKKKARNNRIEDCSTSLSTSSNTTTRNPASERSTHSSSSFSASYSNTLSSIVNYAYVKCADPTYVFIYGQNNNDINFMNYPSLLETQKELPSDNNTINFELETLDDNSHDNSDNVQDNLSNSHDNDDTINVNEEKSSDEKLVIPDFSINPYEINFGKKDSNIIF